MPNVVMIDHPLGVLATMSDTIPVIDVFAGPGGLGEGFSALGRLEGKQHFTIGLSVEKDEWAHSTLELRSFFRQFSYSDVPEEYYAVLRGETTRDQLYAAYPAEALLAQRETWCASLGSGEKFNDELDGRIENALRGSKKWVLIGGPPCQAYSVIGRVRNNGIKDYKPEEDRRTVLYKEYLRIIARHWPTVFVMENVKGLLSSTIASRKVFDEILSGLREPLTVFPEYSGRGYGYHLFSVVKKSDGGQSGDPCLKPEDFIVECEKYGVPQTRHRVILVGVRNDLGRLAPDLLEESRKVPARDVLSGLPKIRSGLSREPDSQSLWKRRLKDVLQGSRWIAETETIWGSDLSDRLRRVLTDIDHPFHDRGGEFIRCDAPVSDGLGWWYDDQRLEGVCNHSSRLHMQKDIYRYLYAACFTELFDRSPKVSEFPADLLPDHMNVATGHFDDRFRVQPFEHPSTTVTCHLSKDGHYYIHPDPHQCRSLTVREAARLQTFPDNYFFCGSRTQQYNQVGNAVPPLLAVQIARIVHDFLKKVEQ